jgi:hypothetical protein
MTIAIGFICLPHELPSAQKGGNDLEDAIAVFFEKRQDFGVSSEQAQMWLSRPPYHHPFFWQPVEESCHCCDGSISQLFDSMTTVFAGMRVLKSKPPQNAPQV